jgi:cytochrome b
MKPRQSWGLLGRLMWMPLISGNIRFGMLKMLSVSAVVAAVGYFVTGEIKGAMAWGVIGYILTAWTLSLTYRNPS